MSKRGEGSRARVPAAARAFSSLHAEEALLPDGPSTARKGGAVLLAMLVLAAVPLFWATNAAGGGDDDDDETTAARTDQTSANGHSTRGTTRDHDTRTGGTGTQTRTGS